LIFVDAVHNNSQHNRIIQSTSNNHIKKYPNHDGAFPHNTPGHW
jgi:hypothetical protein